MIQCDLKKVEHLFKCPQSLRDFKRKNTVARLYYEYGVSTRVWIVAIVGWQIGVTLILMIMNTLIIRKVIILWKIYYSK